MMSASTSCIDYLLRAFTPRLSGADLNEQIRLFDSSDVSLRRIRRHIDSQTVAICDPRNGDYPIHVASAWGHIEICELLIKVGADVNSRNMIFKTPLHYAAARGHLHICRYLVESGADVHAKMQNPGMTPLHNAVRDRHTDIVHYLIENGARVDEKSEPDATALHYACFFSQLTPPRSRSLSREKDRSGRAIDQGNINSNSTINSTSNSNSTRPLAEGGEHTIRKQNGSGSRRFGSSLAAGDHDETEEDGDGDDELDDITRNELELFNLLLDRCPDLINEPDFVSGHTPLHVAACFGKMQLFPLLLERGANPDAVDNEGANCVEVSVSQEVRVALETAIEDLYMKQYTAMARMKNPFSVDREYEGDSTY